MRTDKSLFITSKDDSHADYVIGKLNEAGKGLHVVRINTEDFITNCRISFTEDDFAIHVLDSGREITRMEIYSVWYRRPVDFEFMWDDPYEKAFIAKQAMSLLRGIYFSTHDTARWVNPLPSLHRARIKLQQLVLAKAIGFNVPKTIVSNFPEAITRFIANVGEISTKSLDEPSYKTDGYVYPLFNRKLEKGYIIENLAAVRNCPTLFQQYIEKQSDVRVVVIGNDIYAFEIFSQTNLLSVQDFRGVSPSLLRHELITLPKEIVKKIWRYMKNQQLVYSSFDFVKAKNDKYFFIENNANGQWLWLELQTGVPISNSFINYLLNI